MLRRDLLRVALLIPFGGVAVSHAKTRPDRYESGQVWRMGDRLAVLVNRDDTGMFQETWDTLHYAMFSGKWKHTTSPMHSCVRWPKHTLDQAEYVGRIEELIVASI